MTCMCSDPWCRVHGCKMTAPCLQPSYSVNLPSAGCICPPTSEQTCQNPNCPRKDPFKKE